MEVGVVGAADEIAHRGDGAVGHHLDGLARADRPEVFRLAAEVILDLGHRRKAEAHIKPASLPALTSVDGGRRTSSSHTVDFSHVTGIIRSR